MSCGATFETTKDPQSDLDYRFLWGPNPQSATGWLDGDTLATSSWEVQAGSGFTMHDDSISGTDTIIWLSGGNVADVAWKVTNTITTAAGRTEQRTLAITVEDK